MDMICMYIYTHHIDCFPSEFWVLELYEIVRLVIYIKRAIRLKSQTESCMHVHQSIQVKMFLAGV